MTSTSPRRGHPLRAVPPPSAPGSHPGPRVARRRRHSSVEDRCSGRLLHALRRLPFFTRGGLPPSRHGPASFVVSSLAVATAGCGADRGRMRSLLTPIGSGFTLLTPSCFRTVARGLITLPAIVSLRPPGCRPERSLDELGHLASRRLGRSSNSAPHWVAAPTVTPVLPTNVCKLTIHVSKSGYPLSRCTPPRVPCVGRALGFTPRTRFGEPATEWSVSSPIPTARAYLWRLVVSPSNVAPSERCLHNALEDLRSGARAVP
jgi:hypothetical protein